MRDELVESYWGEVSLSFSFFLNVDLPSKLPCSDVPAGTSLGLLYIFFFDILGTSPNKISGFIHTQSD